jgi:hypothetical protein
MRELARIASLRQDASFSSLGRQLEPHMGRAFTPTEVRQLFFATKRPAAKAVDALSSVLNVSAVHREIVAGRPLGVEEVSAAVDEIVNRVEERSDQYTPRTSAAVRKHLASLEATEREEIARAYLLARERERHGAHLALGANIVTLGDEADRMGVPIVVVAWALLRTRGAFDLFARLRADVPWRSGLVDLQRQLNTLGFLQRHEIDAVIALVVGMLRRRGVETQAMEESLKRKQQSATSRETTANPRKNGGAQP